MCQNESNWNKFVFLMATGKGDPKRKPKSPLLKDAVMKWSRENRADPQPLIDEKLADFYRGIGYK